MSLDENFKDSWKEILVIIIAAIILGLSFSFPGFKNPLLLITLFFIIISINIIAKKIIAYYYEASIKTKFWRWYQYWFTRRSHFKKPIPMLWLPVVVSLAFNGVIQWLGILEFDIQAKTERVSKRHGLYRFSQMAEYHIAIIAATGLIINLIIAIISYITGFTTFAQFNIYYAFFSTIPLSSLDGNKILFGSKVLWTILFIITLVLLAGSFIIV